MGSKLRDHKKIFLLSIKIIKLTTKPTATQHSPATSTSCEAGGPSEECSLPVDLHEIFFHPEAFITQILD